MSTMGLKEKAVLASLGIVILYAIAAVIWFLKMDITSKQGEWNRARRKYLEVCKQYQRECNLIEKKDEWNIAYEAEKASMAKPGGSDSTDTTWSRMVDALAKTNHIEISRHDVTPEAQIDNVHEIEISCAWEGALESLVHFMCDLENSKEGMFDFSALTIGKQTAKPGYLKGTFKLRCAYVKGETDDE